MKSEIEMAREAIKNAAEIRQEWDMANDEYDQMVILMNESSVLKGTLKNLNIALSGYIEQMKDYKIKKMGRKKYGLENLTVDYKLQVLEAEKSNYDKLITNLTRQQQKMKQRLATVTDVTYSIELKRKIAEKKRVS